MPVNMDGVKDASKQVPIGSRWYAQLSIRVFTIQPHTPHHSHDSEHLNYILEGVAKCWRRSGPADNIRRLYPGQTSGEAPVPQHRSTR